MRDTAGVGTHLGATSPIAPNARWAMDFQFDHPIDGRQVKLLNVIDGDSRATTGPLGAGAVGSPLVELGCCRLDNNSLWTFWDGFRTLNGLVRSANPGPSRC